MPTPECSDNAKLDPRVRRTRKLIEDAFKSLLAEMPYGEISVAEVADRATVNRATFYSHYQDKEHLATSMLSGDLYAALCARMTPGMPLNATTLGAVAEALFEFIGQTLGACPKRGDALKPVLATTLQETIQRVLAGWIERDPPALRAFPGVSKETVVSTLAWSLYGGALRWSGLHRRPPASQAANEIVAMLFR